jgi:hypothetical protein
MQKGVVSIESLFETNNAHIDYVDIPGFRDVIQLGEPTSRECI